MTTPRVFIIRHGETEWSLNGRHTGTTDIPLTAHGEARIRATGRALVGAGRLIVPRNLAHVYVSPRRRAQRTCELLGLGSEGPLPWQQHGELAEANKGDVPAGGPREGAKGGDGTRTGGTAAKIEVTEAVREWEYGDYEGVTSREIAESRRKSGEHEWDIWRDGCPGGEYGFLTYLAALQGARERSPQQVTDRLDALIADIRHRFHAHAIGQPKGSVQDPYDVLVVAHGHILRAFAARWIAKSLVDNPSLILEAGGVGTLSYEHHRLEEPAILLGGAFMSDVVEQVEEENK